VCDAITALNPMPVRLEVALKLFCVPMLLVQSLYLFCYFFSTSCAILRALGFVWFEGKKMEGEKITKIDG
jgi:hypothetical protein